MAQAPTSYLSPAVRDKLLNYYATDEVFNAVKATLGIPNLAEKISAIDQFASQIPVINRLVAYESSIQWYDTISDSVYNIVGKETPLMSLANREGTLVSMADQMAGRIVADFFSSLSDLVGIKGTLGTLADVGTFNPLINLRNASTSILDVTSWVTGTTGLGSSRFNMLKTYLDDGWFSGLSDLLSKRTILSELASWRDSINFSLNGIFGKVGGRVLEVGKDASGSRLAILDGAPLGILSDTQDRFSFEPRGLGSRADSFEVFTENIDVDGAGATRPVASMRIAGINPFNILDPNGNRMSLRGVHTKLQLGINGVFADKIVVPLERPALPWVPGQFYITFEQNIIGNYYLKLWCYHSLIVGWIGSVTSIAFP